MSDINLLNKKQRVVNAAHRMIDCADFIKEKYEKEAYQVQKLTFEDNGNSGILVQIRNVEDGLKGTLKTVLGCKTCATLKLLPGGRDLDLEVLAGSWLDKGAVQVFAWYFLWPLLITGSIGAFKQKKLLDDILLDAVSFLAGSESNLTK